MHTTHDMYPGANALGGVREACAGSRSGRRAAGAGRSPVVEVIFKHEPQGAAKLAGGPDRGRLGRQLFDNQI